ncbi:MAG: hypothetical protein IT422_17805 [Pirellulaceae bacterium]|jgi:hypothetical protein|nr:hypothetical protein [Pirellulaceae bacterium]
MNVRLLDEVYLDLRSARDWYNAKRFGLGDEFAELFFRIAGDLPCVSQHHSIDSRRIGSATYFLVSDDADSGFAFVRIESVDNDELRMHLPNPAKFRSAIENGDLNGKVILNRDNFIVRIDARTSSIHWDITPI